MKIRPNSRNRSTNVGRSEWPGLHGWCQHERAAGPHVSRNYRCRRVPPEPSQDLQRLGRHKNRRTGRQGEGGGGGRGSDACAHLKSEPGEKQLSYDEGCFLVLHFPLVPVGKLLCPGRCSAVVGAAGWSFVKFARAFVSPFSPGILSAKRPGISTNFIPQERTLSEDHLGMWLFLLAPSTSTVQGGSRLPASASSW